MRLPRRTLLVATLFLLFVSSGRAQSAADPSGHWEGTISAPFGEVRFEVDLARNAKGELAGTFGQPAQKLKGLPLANVAVLGKAVTFELKATAGGGTFQGDLLADGKSMSGTFIAQAGSVPFSLARTGDARIDALPKSAAIGKQMEGIWNGTLVVDGGQLRLVLKMANQLDGTSTGSIVSIDQGGIELPVAIIQKAADLTLDLKAVGGSYSGTLNPAGTELVGTYTAAQGVALPLTFRRAANH
jgi:hypothetical protein